MVERHTIKDLLDAFDDAGDEQSKKELGRLIRRFVGQFTGLPTRQPRNPLTAQEIEFLRQGRRIPAVKSVKERRGGTLKECLDYVNLHGDKYYVQATPVLTKPISYPGDDHFDNY